jgi:predicted nicotinamide N-methyase
VRIIEPQPVPFAKEATADSELHPWLMACAEMVELETQPTCLTYVPEITLRLAVEIAPLWQKVERDLKLRLGPPYWAVAWTGGLALARHVLDQPDLVKGRRVLDFAAGSALAGIAAAKAGAARVVANDIDPLAAIATSFNADLNAVAIEANVTNLMATDSSFDPADYDVVLVGDVFYAPELAAHALKFLDGCRAGGCEVLIGDPGRVDLPLDHLVKVSSHTVPVTRDAQFAGASSVNPADQDLRAANVWRLVA